MASRNLDDLLPSIKIKAVNVLSDCAMCDIDLIITCTLRTDAEQAALYAQGRKPLAITNQLRMEARLSPINDETNAHIVTNAPPGHSEHRAHGNTGKSRAFDVVPLVAGKPVWNDDALWNKIGVIGKNNGLEWAGDWTSFKEKAHFQDSKAEV